MKNIFLFLVVLFSPTLAPLISCGQSFGKGSTESEFFEYFKANKKSLDPIEGIWFRKSITNTHRVDENKDDKPEFNETETAIVIIQGKMTAFTLIKGVSRLGSLDKFCIFSKNDIPNRYSFSADLTDVRCGYISPIPFTITKNSFSFQYTVHCYTMNGEAIETATRFDNKVTENWSKIYPKPE
jgi:hypothetical protein